MQLWSLLKVLPMNLSVQSHFERLLPGRHERSKGIPAPIFLWEPVWHLNFDSLLNTGSSSNSGSFSAISSKRIGNRMVQKLDTTRKTCT